MGKRRKGREIVLQSMYASLISGAPLLDTVEDQISRRNSASETQEFARRLAGIVKQNSAEIERWLRTLVTAKRAPSRLGTLEICILSLGLAELKYCPDVPFRVAINEACELAHHYCDDGAAGFVNGVLDRAARETYPATDRAAVAAGDAVVDEADGTEDPPLDADFGDDEPDLGSAAVDREDMP